MNERNRNEDERINISGDEPREDGDRELQNDDIGTKADDGGADEVTTAPMKSFPGD